MSIFTHPCQRPVSLPLCTCPYSPPPAQVTCWSRQSLARKRPKSDQTKCHAPFSARKHVRLVKVWLENAQNKPRPEPTFGPSRIRFLILIEFSLTTPNRGMVPPVHTGRRAKLLLKPGGGWVGRGRSREHTLGRDLTRPLTPQESVFLY